jgi:hypothetical protein
MAAAPTITPRLLLSIRANYSSAVAELTQANALQATALRVRTGHAASADREYTNSVTMRRQEDSARQ